VPDEFATTAEANRRFIGATELSEKIRTRLAEFDTDDLRELARIG
jgi:phosphoenolpyruvate synthase/pyruvate phosphate dikinase